MPQIGPLEIGVVVLIALVVFGPHRLPEMARQAGSAWRQVRRMQQDLRDDLHDMVHDDRAAAAAPPAIAGRADRGDRTDRGDRGDRESGPVDADAS